MQQLIKLAKTTTSHQSLLRRITTATTTNTTAVQHETVKKEILFQQLYQLKANGGKVSDVIHRNIKMGKRVTKPILIDCFKDLRRISRFDHCLQILEWLEKGRYDYSSREHALRLNMLCKLKGLGEVEKYFDTIPADAKDQKVYGALLHCYCEELAVDKALSVFEKMDEMGFSSHVLVFNSLLSLYLKVGQPEKNQALLTEMKNRSITMNGHTYSFLIQSYRLLGDLEGVERVFHEAENQASKEYDWVLYSNAATVFMEFGQPAKAISQLQKLENLLDNSDKAHRAEYHSLISLYASAGKLESVMRVWNKLTSKFKVTNLYTYLNLLEALSNLDDIKGLNKYFQEWESSSEKYDDRMPATVIGAYLRHGMLAEAELLLKDSTKKAGRLLGKPHVVFMNYYFEKHDINPALKHMEVAIASNWKPHPEKLDPCFQCFKAEKDVDGAEKFCRLLKSAAPLDTIAYSGLLQTYAAAEKTAPDMRGRIEEDGIIITPELEELLERVCPT